MITGPPTGNLPPLGKGKNGRVRSYWIIILIAAILTVLMILIYMIARGKEGADEEGIHELEW